MKNHEPRNTVSPRSLPPLPDTNPGGQPQVPVLHSDREHSKISPSKLKALEICPGFLPDDTGEVHEITAIGTKCHEALDSGDFSGLTEEELGLVKKCKDYVGGLLTPQAKQFNELRLDILDGIWGFADLFILHGTGTLGDLVDYKFSFNAQEDAETNPAAQAYVLGLFQKFPGLEEVDVHYLYPRRDEISKATYTRADVPRIRLRIQTIVARVEHASLFSGRELGLGLNPVPGNCQYCGRKATCQALHKMVLPIATRYAERKELAVPQGDFSLVKNPEDWSRLMAYVPVLEAMADSIKRHALEFREQSGVEIPGYELRSRQGRKTITNAEIAYKKLVVEGGANITHEEFLRCVEVSPKKLADCISENSPRGQKGKDIANAENLLRDAGVLEVGGETFFLARSRK